MSDEEYMCPLLRRPCLEEKCMWWVFEEDTCVMQVLCTLFGLLVNNSNDDGWLL